MKYIFRGNIVFTYDPERKEVVQGKIHNTIAAFDYCKFINKDYKLLAKFFNMAYQHAEGNITDEELEDIEVN